MKMNQVVSGTFLAAAFAVGLSAQTPAPQTPAPQTPTPQSSAPMADARDSAKTVTVTGCLKAGEQADSFVLSDIKWDKSKDKDRASGAVGTSGSTAASPAIASATTLKLNPSPSTKLAEHVGHQVEVSGTISDRATTNAAPPSDPAATRPAKADAALDVRNVKMLAATCSM